MKAAILALSLAALAVACSHRATVATNASASWHPAFTIAGQFSVPALTHFPPESALRFGGISGLASSGVPGEYLGISDDHGISRIYKLHVSGVGPEFRFAPVDYIALQPSPEGPAQLDPESVVLAPDGHFFVTSEGFGNVEPRLPPALLEFGPNGAFIRQLPVPNRFIPNPTGPLVKGVRSNLGFEGLAVSRGGDRLFVGTEGALVQDGELTGFDRGAPSRIVEYTRRGGTFVPGREFVYLVEPIVKPPFAPGFAVNGLVELLALDDGSLLALERSYVTEAGNTGRNVNRIRLFRISVAGASDVSGIDSLRNAPKSVPVVKTPLLDLADVAGLSPELAPSLDNFEALAFGPPLPDGRRSLLLVSDDNFNPTQRTWFLLFAYEGDLSRQRIQ